jgi:hypothetical protein
MTTAKVMISELRAVFGISNEFVSNAKRAGYWDDVIVWKKSQGKSQFVTPFQALVIVLTHALMIGSRKTVNACALARHAATVAPRDATFFVVTDTGAGFPPLSDVPSIIREHTVTELIPFSSIKSRIDRLGLNTPSEKPA